MRYAEGTNGSDPTNLIEVNGLFELYTEGGHTSYRNMVAAPTGIVAVYTVRDDSLVTTRYLTTDHLGSNSEVTNEVGGVAETMSYDAFGAKRDPNTWQTYAFGSAPHTTDITDKGYTGQQQLDTLGLIHMNGRVQDPYTGRFVSADPTVPDPFYSQSFNRFAYVYNNPLNSIDPSGFDDQSLTFNVQSKIPGVSGSYTMAAQVSGAGNTFPSTPFQQPTTTLNLGQISFGSTPIDLTSVQAAMTDVSTLQTINTNSISTGSTTSFLNTVPGSNEKTMSGRDTEGQGNFGDGLCVSGNCDGNGVADRMDSIDGATTYDGAPFTGNDAQGPTGPLGGPLHPVVNPFIPLGSMIANAGGGGPTKGANPTATGSLGVASGLGKASTIVGMTSVPLGAAQYGIPLVHFLDNSRLAQGLMRYGRVLGPVFGYAALLLDGTKLGVDAVGAHPGEVGLVHDGLNVTMDFVSFGGWPGYLVGTGYTGLSVFGGSTIDNAIFGTLNYSEAQSLQGAQTFQGLQNIPATGSTWEWGHP